MKKLYTILTSFIILVLVIHMIYMTLILMNILPPNEDLAQNLGYTLMYSAILHGIYGMVKWIRTFLYQRKLKRRMKSLKRVKMSHAERITMLQRILGLCTLIIIFPHGYIKFLSAGVLPLIADICYIIALLVHLWIGFPKWMVSLGIRPANVKSEINVISGGRNKWK